MRHLFFRSLWIVILLVGCRTCQNTPDGPPIASCLADVGAMMPAPDPTGLYQLVLDGVYPCFACEKASGCVKPGDQYCCAERMCSECSIPEHVVRPQAAKPDLGSVDGGR